MPILKQLIDLLWLRIGPELNVLASEGRFKNSANTVHEEIIALAEAGDALALGRAVQRDILEAANYLTNFLVEK